MMCGIKTDDHKYLKGMKEEFTRTVPGFQFMPQYRAGNWNGRVCMINPNRTFPYGILMDYIRIHKKNFLEVPIEIDEDVKKLFKGPALKLKYDLALKPRPYQKDCIESAIRTTKGIIRSATASGKSLVIAYILKNLFLKKSTGVKKSIIIVPSTSLITQFHEDLVEYGFDESIIGEVHGKRKQWDTPLTISTWQSLSRNTHRIGDYDAVIVDEVHGAKAHVLKKILANCHSANYRLGFTGTLHSSELDNWNTKSYLGPVIKEYPSGLLADEGWISKCTVNFLNIEYITEFEGSYNDVKDAVFQNEFRLKVVRELVNKLDHNILLLVGKVEKEGDFLKEYLLEKGVNKEVIFLSGRDDVDKREKWRKKCVDCDNIAMIATYGIFQQGINIPNLKYVGLIAPFKSKIRVLQSIGRALRKHSNKEKDGALIFDIHDHTIHFEKYGDIRLRYYDSEKFEVKESLYHEGDELISIF